MIWWLLLAGLLALFVVVWRHGPTRRMVRRTFDPSLDRPGTVAVVNEGLSLRDHCDVAWDIANHAPPDLSAPLPGNPVIWVHTGKLADFLESDLPQKAGPFVLVTEGAAQPSGKITRRLLGTDNLLHWFASARPAVAGDSRVTVLPERGDPDQWAARLRRFGPKDQ